MPLELQGPYLDLVEAAGEIGIHPEHLRRLVRYGRVSATKVERGVYFRLEDITALAAIRRVRKDCRDRPSDQIGRRRER